MTNPEPASLKKGARRGAKKFLNIDMTPMVDLGFLLITFFILTTSMTEKRASPLVMPKPSDNGSDVAESHALTVLLGGNNKVMLYSGRFQPARQLSQIFQSDYSENAGIGFAVREKQDQLRRKGGSKEREMLTVVIKPMPNSSYKNIIDAMDEMLINGVTRYAIVDPSKEELDLMKQEDVQNDKR